MLDAYQYATGNSVDFFDPTGLAAITDAQLAASWEDWDRHGWWDHNGSWVMATGTALAAGLVAIPVTGPVVGLLLSAGMGQSSPAASTPPSSSTTRRHGV